MTYQATILVDSPFTALPLNETNGTTANDVSGNAHNGTYNGTFTLAQPGRVTDPGSAAVKLDGSSGFVNVPSAGVPTGNASFTQELWFMLNAIGSTQLLIGWGTGLTLEEPNFYVDSSGNLVMSTWNTDTTVQLLSLATWYYAANTYDGTTHKAYVNGQFVTQSTPGTVATPATPAFTIGRNPSPSEFFASITTQWAAGYATPLSAARIQAHYLAGIAVLGQVSMLTTPRQRVHPVPVLRWLDPIVVLG